MQQFLVEPTDVRDSKGPTVGDAHDARSKSASYLLGLDLSMTCRTETVGSSRELSKIEILSQGITVAGLEGKTEWDKASESGQLLLLKAKWHGPLALQECAVHSQEQECSHQQQDCGLRDYAQGVHLSL